jgi:DNA repair exonuclease SbcCD ATPase subunit
MILKTLVLKNYKRFSNKTFEFDPKLNIILGKNETGKSTLASSILDCLYSDVETKSKAFLAKIQSWNSEKKPYFELQFDEGKESYLLVKDFESRTAKLENTTLRNELNDSKEIQQSLQKILGINDEEIYGNTGFIKQQDISRISTNSKMVSNLQTASKERLDDVDLHTKIKKVKEEIADLKRGLANPAKNPGPIKKFEDNFQKHQAEFLEMKAKWNEGLKKLKEREEVCAKFESLQKDFERLKISLESTEKYRQATAKLKDIIAQINRVSQDIEAVEESHNEINKIDIKLYRYKGLLGANREGTVGEFVFLSEQNKVLESESMKLSIKIQEVKNSFLFKIIRILPFLSFVFGILAFIFIELLKIAFIGWMSASLSIAFLFIFGILFVLKNNQVSTLIYKNRKREIEDAIQNNERKMDFMLEKYQIETREDFLNAEVNIKDLTNEKEKFQQIIKSLLRGGELNSLQDEYRRLLIEKEQIEVSQLDADTTNSRLDANAYAQALGSHRQLVQSLEDLQKKKLILDSEISNMEVVREDINYKEVELAEIESKLLYYKKRLQVLEILIVFLERSVADTSSLLATILRKDIQDYFSQITEGKYNEVRFGDDLSIEIFSKEANGWVDPHQNLSEGALDQLSFLIRLSYFKMLAKKQSPFMILDDPFVNFDFVRRDNAMQIVKKEAEKFQILFFSHDEALSKYGRTLSF